ncbi:hypothetical protein [Agromyces sp. NPDC058064]|uniref:hypothetical protein n=1 Tax=Agromyces sp. NPDC058064 TaxID=3346322 RepID=UPI0036DA6590
MTDTSGGLGEPHEDEDADRTDLPATKADDEEAEARRGDAVDASAGTVKPDGLGSGGTIPNVPGGVGVGAGAPTTFEPEEDVEAARRRDDRSAI